MTESLQQQTATADVLKVISRSAFDLEPALVAICETAARLCDADQAAIFKREGDLYGFAASFGFPPEYGADWRALGPRAVDPKSHLPGARSVVERRPVHVLDLAADPAFHRSPSRQSLARSALGVPLLRDGEPIGNFVLGRRRVEAFTDRQIELVQTFADQAVIAIENTRLFNETQEALERQTATSNVLQVISQSMAETAPVFESILDSCEKLIQFNSAGIALVDGDQLRLQAARGPGTRILWSLFPQPLNSIFGEAIRGRKPIYTVNVAESATATDAVRLAARKVKGYSLLQVPMLWQDRSVGSLSIARLPNVGFSDNEVSLLKTFAAQAVIAIENTRLFNEVQARTRDLAESLQHQTATADVLKVISRSVFDVQSVLDTLVESAYQLCGAKLGLLYLKGDEAFECKAIAGSGVDDANAYFKGRPIRAGRATAAERVILTGKVESVTDFFADPEFDANAKEIIRKSGNSGLGVLRSTLAVPMMRDNSVIGVLVIASTQTGAFPQRQVDLLQTFADQAVIAIENARLFNETQEALEQQTATSEVLQVIGNSMADSRPVFERILESTMQLFDCRQSALVLAPGDGLLHVGARRGTGSEVMDSIYPQPIGETMAAIVLEKRQQTYIADAMNDPAASLSLRRVAEVHGNYSIVMTPMIWEGRGIGMISVIRDPNTPFNDKELNLLRTFADQAVIAIQNARLFNETREALAYQTGSSNVLRVIASSPTDVAPVLNAIVESARELCEAIDAVVLLKDGEHLRFSAHSGPLPVTIDKWPIGRGWTAGRAFVDQKPVHVHDMLSADGADFPDARAMGQSTGVPIHTVLSVPLLREGESIGAILLRRGEVRPFIDKQISLLSTFADQAVIAIENTRLFNETQEALERQTATADILKVIASSPSDVAPVFEAIAERSNRLIGGLSTAVYSIVDDVMHLMAFTRSNPEADAALQASFPRPLSEADWSDRIRNREVVEIPDAQAEWAEQPWLRDLARLRGFCSLLFVPLLRDGAAVGIISVTRRELGKFAPHHVQLLQTFADQAVIAIGNVELFKQVQQRTLELSKSLDDLRTAQDRLVQTEKLASLGQLTAGIAHEIKNPLNFVNNFSALSAELIDEMTEVFENPALDEAGRRKELDEIRELLKGNLEKVVQHGKRANSIVKNMLLHSREGSGERRAADLNALVSESLNLAYHGARAERSDFNITLEQHLDPDAGAVEVYPQELTRALLNLISNGFYAAIRRKMDGGGAVFEPVLSAATKNAGEAVEIRIRDNGTGIPPDIREKIFNPFFTTKPTGEGTGLGLSMTHDIIVKQHGGRIDVATEPGAFTEFTITLPRGNGSAVGPK